MLLIPVRTLLVPRLPFTKEELALLDGPTASPFVSPIVVTFFHSSLHGYALHGRELAYRLAWYFRLPPGPHSVDVASP